MSDNTDVNLCVKLDRVHFTSAALPRQSAPSSFLLTDRDYSSNAERKLLLPVINLSLPPYALCPCKKGLTLANSVSCARTWKWALSLRSLAPWWSHSVQLVQHEKKISAERLTWYSTECTLSVTPCLARRQPLPGGVTKVHRRGWRQRTGKVWNNRVHSLPERKTRAIETKKGLYLI